MTEKRRLNADICGLITTDRDGCQCVANLVRGTEVTIGKSGFFSTLIESPDYEYRVDHATLKRLRERSVKIDS